MIPRGHLPRRCSWNHPSEQFRQTFTFAQHGLRFLRQRSFQKPPKCHIYTGGSQTSQTSPISSYPTQRLNTKTTMSETYRPGWDKPLDPSIYDPDDEEIAFMKATTGIQNDEELKKHIFAVQAKAFSVSICAMF